jgi:hypothetical protein
MEPWRRQHELLQLPEMFVQMLLLLLRVRLLPNTFVILVLAVLRGHHHLCHTVVLW